jgi:hypothetical protein
MYNLCRLSKVRQEDAAMHGIIPLLQKIMKTKRPPKEFALPILCDMAHSGKIGRKYLWQNKGLQFYVSLLRPILAGHCLGCHIHLVSLTLSCMLTLY